MIQLRNKFVLYSLFAIMLFLHVRLLAQDALNDQHHVVIGAFSDPLNAMRFAEKARSDFERVTIKANPVSMVNYVVVFTSTDLDKAKEVIYTSGIRDKYSDAWIFHQWADKPATMSDTLNYKVQDHVAMTSDTVATELVAEKAEVSPKSDQVEVQFVNTNGHRIDTDFWYKENGSISFDKYHSSSKLARDLVYNKEWMIRTKVIGYKSVSVKKEDIIQSPTGKGTTIAIPLVPIEQGDFIQFTAIRFKSKSAIMEPESEEQIKQLISYLNEYPLNKIEIIGHVNKGQEGKVVTRAPGEPFFGKVKSISKKVSAKELSRLRAEEVKQYMVQNGIDEARVLVKAMGSSSPLFSKNGEDGDDNNRLEGKIL